jgi:hypothetical protein
MGKGIRMTKEQLLAEAMVLDPEQRGALAEELWLSLDGASRQEIDAAWLDEARKRDAELAAGVAKTSSVDEVLGRLMARGRQ